MHTSSFAAVSSSVSFKHGLPYRDRRREQHMKFGALGRHVPAMPRHHSKHMQLSADQLPYDKAPLDT